MLKRILVPLDGSDISEKVLPLACTIAGSSDAEIILLRVVEYPPELYKGYDDYALRNPEVVKKIELQKKTIRDEMADHLEKISTDIRDDGLRVCYEVCEGPVVDAILASIDRLCIDLIAMTSLGEGGGNSWMIGSIADRLLRESKIQVFLVRPVQEDLRSDSPRSHANSFARITDEKSKARLWPSFFS